MLGKQMVLYILLRGGEPLESKLPIRLRELRGEHGLTQQELADRLGVERSTITAYENGRNFPAKNIFRRIAEFFGESMDWIDGRTDTRQNPELQQLQELLIGNDSLRLLVKEAKSLTPSDIRTLVRITAALRKESSETSEK